jgi:hypothetical protein
MLNVNPSLRMFEIMNNFRFKYDMLHMSTETNHITKSLVE